jgi:ABC-type uncharacterized transport system involved in gliding motility auxiliary subunit
MNINLTPFMILAALLLTSVAAMVIWRKVVAREEDDNLHVLDAKPRISQQLTMAQRLEVIDKWGKLLTIVTVGYLLIVAALVIWKQFTVGGNLGS